MSFFEELSPEMDAYLEKHASAEPKILQELAHVSYENTTHGHMISGHQQGRLLSILTHLHRPKLVLEIGTFTGYASIAIAQALEEDGRLITLDKNEKTSAIARAFFEKAGVQHKIQMIETDALWFVKETELCFDMVFIDADKENYPEYYRQVLPKVVSDGMILIDNTLWYGKVLEAEPKKKHTQAIQELNAMVANDKRVEAIILPLRDGLTLIRKK